MKQTEKNTRKILKKKGGITLIALVVTIIVLLILAGISILMLTGDNGILTRAGEAKERTGESQIKEEIALAWNGVQTEGIVNGWTLDQKAGALQSELKKEDSSATATPSGNNINVKNYKGYDAVINTTNGSFTSFAKSNGDGGPTVGTTITLEMTHQAVAPTVGGNVASVNSENVPIPTGFYQVAGTTVSTGLVISSVSGDDLENSKGGDQFVWIPVDQNQKLKLEVESSETITGITLYDPFGNTIPLGTISGNSYTNSNIDPTVNGEYRVEVTTASGTETKTLVVRSLYAVDVLNDWYSSDEYAVTQGYGNISELIDDRGYDTKEEYVESEWAWLSEFSDTEDYTTSVNTNGGFYIGRFEAGIESGERTSGDESSSVESIKTANGLPVSKIRKNTYNYVTRDQAQGLADLMYKGKSHLVTGAAWDRALGWLVNTGSKTLAQIARDSKDWGNYSDSTFTATGRGSLEKTGAFENNTKANNIYDLAGNVYEWTSETDDSNCCVGRGGNFRSAGAVYPASSRNFIYMFHFDGRMRFPCCTLFVALSTAGQWGRRKLTMVNGDVGN